MFLNHKPNLDLDQVNQVLRQRGFTIIDIIGHGAYSTGFLIHYEKYDSMLFVAKVFHSPSKTFSSLQNAYMAELLNLQRLAHTNIIRIYQAFQENQQLYIILEYCDGGTLLSKIKEKGIISHRELRYYCQQILSAMAYIHSQNIAHRDIKPENIFITGNNIVKIADFGLSSHVEHGQMLHTFVGSIPYCPPEVLDQENYNPFQADIWSLGITFYKMAVGKLPFNSASKESLRKSIDLMIYPIPQNLDHDFVDLLGKMIVFDPRKRYSMDNLLRHPYFTKNLQNSIPSRSNNEGLLYRKNSPLFLPRIVSLSGRTMNRNPRRHSGKVSMCTFRKV